MPLLNMIFSYPLAIFNPFWVKKQILFDPSIFKFKRSVYFVGIESPLSLSQLLKSNLFSQNNQAFILFTYFMFKAKYMEKNYER